MTTGYQQLRPNSSKATAQTYNHPRVIHFSQEKMSKALRILALTIPALAGCATPVAPYALPSGSPHAKLKSSIYGANGRYESIDIYLFDGQASPPGNRQLFSIRQSKSKPSGYVQVPAGTPLRISYYEAASGGRTCQLFIQVILEEGKHYSLDGGFAYESGPIPILTGARKCRLSVIEDGSSKPIPLL